MQEAEGGQPEPHADLDQFQKDGKKLQFVYAGAVKSVVVSGKTFGESEDCLGVSVKDEKGDTKTIKLDPAFFTTYSSQGMYPTADHPLWSYIPSWYYDCRLAANAINNVVASLAELPAKVLEKAPKKEDLLKTLTEMRGRRPYSYRLILYANEGRFGWFTCHEYTSPVTRTGMQVYKKALESCKVNRPAIL